MTIAAHWGVKQQTKPLILTVPRINYDKNKSYKCYLKDKIQGLYLFCHALTFARSQ